MGGETVTCATVDLRNGSGRSPASSPHRGATVRSVASSEACGVVRGLASGREQGAPSPRNQGEGHGSGQRVEACAVFRRGGARPVRLNVSAPFHSRYMRDTAEEFARFLGGFTTLMMLAIPRRAGPCRRASGAVGTTCQPGSGPRVAVPGSAPRRQSLPALAEYSQARVQIYVPRPGFVGPSR
jgi:hypothetical protein